MTRRGAVLLEAILALAIFVATSLAIVSVIGRAVRAVASARELRDATDLARSAMARLEVGVSTPETLNGPAVWPVRSGDDDSAPDEMDPSWSLEIRSEPAAQRGLTRISMTVLRSRAGAAPRPIYTLHQYVRFGSARPGGAS